MSIPRVSISLTIESVQLTIEFDYSLTIESLSKGYTKSNPFERRLPKYFRKTVHVFLTVPRSRSVVRLRHYFYRPLFHGLLPRGRLLGCCPGSCNRKLSQVLSMEKVLPKLTNPQEEYKVQLQGCKQKENPLVFRFHRSLSYHITFLVTRSQSSGPQVIHDVDRVTTRSVS